MTQSRKLKIAVIGAGAAGIMAVVKLREIGQTDVCVYERASDIGGTWRDNRYPGIACDVPSHLYRYSFAPNAEWSRSFAPGKEILAYLRSVYEQAGVGRHVTFNAEVTDATYSRGKWTLETTSGTKGPFDVVITAMGILRFPVYPDIPGLSTFAGLAVHSARWGDATDLRGKRVGIIGSGSTATQIASAIVGEVGRLSMFQRTAQWILPVANSPIAEEEREEFRRNPALMQARYEQLAQEFNGKFAAATVGENPRFYAHMTKLCEEHLVTAVGDPVLREKLRPNYKVGCKRIVMSDSFYEAVQRPNAELVTEKITSVEPAGVRTSDGRLHELDVLVLATGYEAHATLAPMRVSGKDGCTIAEAWKDAEEAYLGVSVPGFPNFFMIGGPGSPIGNFSFLMTAENQCAYAMNMISFLASGHATALSPKTEAMRQFNKAVQERMPSTIWVSGCKNWYMDKNGNIALWPWSWEHFEKTMRKPNLDHFEILDAAQA
jgi:cation diffusion facilitator CzcD-associated flavoprotein CzcO